jgi:hypothetical protein
MTRIICLILLFGLNLPGGKAQSSYFVDDLSGNDMNPGNSIQNAWKSIDRLNSAIFQPGDSVLFCRGGRWKGNFCPKGSGTEGRPIVVTAYGNGPLPELDAAGVIAKGAKISATIRLFNQEYWEFSNLKIKNFRPFEKPVRLNSETKNAWTNSTKIGIFIEGRDAGTLHHIHFTGLEICDVNGAMETKDNGGIYMDITWSDDPAQRKITSFEDVILQNSYIHDVDRTGFSNMSVWWNRSLNSKWGEKLTNGKIHNWFPSKGIIIRNNRFERTGANALIVRVAEYPVIEFNLFTRCASKGSGNASFPFNCDNALFQHNEACYTVYNTEADSWDGKKDADAGGFDSDWNCKNTIIQYNYSHDNGFGGVLICCDGGSKNNFNDGTVLRYNVFENNGDHMIRTSGPATNSKIYNNLFYSGPEQDSVMVIYHKSWNGFSDSTLYKNNIFVARGKGCFFNTGQSTKNFFHANLFDGILSNKPLDPEAIDANPLFVGENGQLSANPVLRYLLQRGSPAIHSGLPVRQNGLRDYLGNETGSKPSRGPFEFR